ncbi:MAG: DNA repair protein RadA [Myxococcales bacterium]
MPLVPKARTVHVCQACGYQTAKWLGQCPDCRAWGSIVEEAASGSAAPRGLGGVAAKPVALSEVSGESQLRAKTGIGELDRVLGGGLVPGSLVLLGGDPGIGKSTLLLAALDRLAAEGPVLYVSGEESARQTKLRADRLGVAGKQLQLLCETDAERVLKAARELRPRALAVDSIQTLYLPDVPSAPGSVAQVREVAGRLLHYAKTSEVPTFIVGHVTKDGAIAGPRVLEHLVDTVLYFEGDRGHAYRVLRAHKNRFGSTHEIGVFEMRGEGLAEVKDPSGLFLAERPAGVPGSAVTAALEGSRPVLYEIQALCAPAAYGTARRTSIGIDGNRVALLAAVLEKKAAVDMVGCDVFVNVAGGAEIDEPAADLAVVAALASSVRDRALDPHTVVMGEVGLAGEVRAVGQPEPRLREAARLGFKRALLPRANAERCKDVPIEKVPVADVASALAALLG